MLEAIAAFVRNASPAVFLGVSVASGIVIFSGESVATSLGVDQFRTTYRGELGIAFLASVSMFLATSVWSLSSFIRRTIVQRSEEKRKPKLPSSGRSNARSRYTSSPRTRRYI